MCYITSMDKLHQLYQLKLNRQTKELDAVVRANDNLKSDKAKMQEKLSHVQSQLNVYENQTQSKLVSTNKKLKDEIQTLKDKVEQ